MCEILGKPQFFIGLDIGTYAAKAVAVNSIGEIVDRSISQIKGNFPQAITKVLDAIFKKHSFIKDVYPSIAVSGIGKYFVKIPKLIFNEIQCQSHAIYHLFPKSSIIIEIGNEATKIIKVGHAGIINDYIVSDKCANSGGRILAIAARIMGISSLDSNDITAVAKNPTIFNSGCAVFLETEIISRIAEGADKQDIVAGIYKKLAANILSLVNRLGGLNEHTFCVVTGGGANVPGLTQILEETLGHELHSPSYPEFTLAYGAALKLLKGNVNSAKQIG